MRVLLAVLEDLWLFGKHSVVGLLLSQGHQSFSHPLPSKTLTQTSVGSSVSKAYPPTLLLSGSTYFIGEDTVLVYTQPAIAFDVCMGELRYGQTVEVTGYSGRWASIMIFGRQGWVLKDVLREKARDVQPAFVVGELYDERNSETQKLRRTIGDSFLGGASDSLLQDAEYTAYMVEKKGRVIPWGSTRPRIAGTWQKHLRGAMGVFMSITPKTDTVMEYVTEEGVGHLAYVSSVFPDESIFITGFGLDEEGVYSEMMLSKETYKELRPVFIEIQ